MPPSEHTLEKQIFSAARQLTATLPPCTAAIEARVLMRFYLQAGDDAQLIKDGDMVLSPKQLAQFSRLVKKRLAGTPMAYITGRQSFLDGEFIVTPAALIPRRETEELATATLTHASDKHPQKILDLGTGCGAIGISIAKMRPHSQVMLTDLNSEALALATKNAEKFGVKNTRLHFGDWYEAITAEDSFDLIVSNPPYICAADPHLKRGDLRFEPQDALRAGDDGLESLHPIIRRAPTHLKRGGVLLVEHGWEQAEPVRRLFARAGFCGIRQLKDLAGIVRITLAVKP